VFFFLPIALYAAALPNSGDVIHIALIGLDLLVACLLTVALLETNSLYFVTFWIGLVVWQNAALGVFIDGPAVAALFPIVELKTVTIYLAGLHALVRSSPSFR